jgi:diguanylate cyclase (GGDEF)-like protein
MTAPLTTNYQPQRDYVRSFLLLRWLVLILAAYLSLFSYADKRSISFLSVYGFILAFTISNIVCMLLSYERLQSAGFRKAIAIADVFFVSITFYLLRVDDTYLFAAFILVYVMAEVWRDLKIVAFSIIAVSLLYGGFSSMRLYGRYSVFSTLRIVADNLGHDLEQFLALSLFFVVAIFYLFLTDRLRHDANLSGLLMEEKRRADIMAEITRSLSSSLNSQEIFFLIVRRICDVFDAVDCSIVRLDSLARTGRMLVRSSDSSVKDAEIDLSAYPELQQANDSRDLLFVPEVVRAGGIHSVVVMPMLAQDHVLGLIHVQLKGKATMSEEDTRFFKVMSLTAANALRNAQLFEEMEHRARTDFLTGLPNHRFFQSTLSTELVRAQRHNHPLSLLIIDLDFLKDVNDRFGHPTGDTVIRAVGETIRITCRDFDFAARYGGEEFTVILPETPLTGAIQVADRIRERISFMVFPGVGHVTASIGVSNYPVNALGKEDLIRVADQALYIAKNNGRDRVAYFNYQLVTR